MESKARQSDTQCPSAEILGELLDGRLREPALSEYAAHIEDCAHCQRHARTLGPSDTLVESLRGNSSPPEELAASIPELLLQALKQIPQLSSESRLGQAIGLRAGDSPPTESDLEFLEPPQADDEIGRLGPYRILQVLGHGGMGIVFLAEDPNLGRRVALKVMRPRIASLPAARARFLVEARSAARLQHDNIVTIYQVNELNGAPCLAMELLVGQSLDAALRSGRRFSPAETVQLARDMAAGLAAAHENGLVHRDIKPANLWLMQLPDDSFRVKLLDFGLAWEGKSDRLTEFGTILGTPEFMAPEQARADRPVDGRADLFSLGAVLYLLTTSEQPFRAETIVGTLLALAVETPATPAALNQAVPLALSQLIMQLLEKDPANRPQSAREVIQRLNEIDCSIIEASRHPLPQATRRGMGRALKIATGGLFSGFVALAIYTLWWQTPAGRIVRIDCDDPEIRLAVNGGELKVIGAYDQPLVIKPGPVDLKITKPEPGGGEFIFESNKLVVRKGDQLVLKVEALNNSIRLIQEGGGLIDSRPLPLQGAPATSYERDRQAAEWALWISGNVGIREFDPLGQPGTNVFARHVHTRQQLSANPFELFRVTLLDNKQIMAADFAILQDLEHLDTLILDGCGERVNSDAIAYLRGCRRLNRLGALGCGLTDRALETLRQLPNLEVLGLAGNVGVTDAGLITLKQFPALKELYIGGTGVTDAGLVHFRDWPRLEILGLVGPAFTDTGLAHVAANKTLKSLVISSTYVSDATIELLAAQSNLVELAISDTWVTDRGLESLHALQSLRVLLATETTISPGAIERLRMARPEIRIEYSPIR